MNGSGGVAVFDLVFLVGGGGARVSVRGMWRVLAVLLGTETATLVAAESVISVAVAVVALVVVAALYA
jgi:hypothetical protein